MNVNSPEGHGSFLSPIGCHMIEMVSSLQVMGSIEE